jgi:uncharacterized membrane protein YphA (DoxX/SURF4 family)
MSLQRAFSSFPSGWAGIALLALRLLVGASAVLQTALLIAAGRSARVAVATALAMAIAGVALTIGFVTPIASALLCMGGAGIMLACLPPTPLFLFDSRMAAFEFVVMSAVLVILGPGAISVDARLFGRRQVEIPEAPRPNDP